MKDLKSLNVDVFGNLREDETIQIYLNGVPAEYNPREILGLINKLAKLQKTLVENLVYVEMNKIDEED